MDIIEALEKDTNEDEGVVEEVTDKLVEIESMNLTTSKQLAKQLMARNIVKDHISLKMEK